MDNLPNPPAIIKLECGHRYYEGDPRLEADDCAKCFNEYHAFVDKL